MERMYLVRVRVKKHNVSFTFSSLREAMKKVEEMTVFNSNNAVTLDTVFPSDNGNVVVRHSVYIDNERIMNKYQKMPKIQYFGLVKLFLGNW